MNSYTLTFKKKIFILFFVVISMISILDVLLVYIADRKTSNSKYINDKFSKIKHFELNNSKSKDIVFVGSSRTFYHISTNIFKKSNINIANLGVSGMNFEDYPTIINEIVKYNPKQVVISLNVYDLYSSLPISKFPTKEELSQYYDVNKFLFLDVLKEYVINFHTFLQYSEVIYFKLQSIYDAFNSKVNLSNNETTLKLDTADNYSTLVDCKVFDIKRTHEKQITLKCDNGDGVLIGSFISQENKSKKINYNLKNINENSIKYLQLMIDRIKNNNINVVIILEPILENKYVYDINIINNKLGSTKIIDLTNFSIDKNLWSDEAHLNYLGRDLYSNYLVPLINSQ